MNGLIRILLVEDVVADAELALRELKRAKLSVDARRVETFADYRRELETFHPQVILCDFSMPKFDGLEALRIARQSHPDIPFIFVSGTIGEESAVTALKNGAKDYVLKGSLLRLPAAIERALQETEERRVRRAHEQELRESERLYRSLFQSDPLPRMVYDIATLRLLAVNKAAEVFFGHGRDEFLAMNVRDLLLEDGVRELLDHAAKPAPEITDLGVRQFRTRNGQLQAKMTFHELALEGKLVRVMVIHHESGVPGEKVNPSSAR